MAHEDRRTPVGVSQLAFKCRLQRQVAGQAREFRRAVPDAAARRAARSRRPAKSRRSTMRSDAMPAARSAAMNRPSTATDSRMPASSARPSAVSVLMSYQARMRMPMLSVTGRTRACGNTKRTASAGGNFSSGTIGTKSWPSAPRPCSQMTLAEAGVAGARTTASADSCRRWVTGSAVVARAPDHTTTPRARAPTSPLRSRRLPTDRVAADRRHSQPG